MPIGETIFLNVILQEAPVQTPDIPPHDIITGGSTNLKILAPNNPLLGALHSLYSMAISRTFILATVTAAVALPFALLMDWKVPKKRSMEEISELGSMRNLKLMEPRSAGDGRASIGHTGRDM